MTSRFIGLKEANRALLSLPEAAKPGVQKVMDVTAYNVSRGALARVARRTGFLASHIGWQSRPRTLAAVVGVDKGTAFYWKFIEYGTVKMGAQPFLRPAAESEEPKHHAALVQELERAGDRIERGAGVAAVSSRLL